MLPDRDMLERALGELDEPWAGGPYSERAREAFPAGAETVRRLLRRFDELAAELAAAASDVVVTHGEPHPGNLIRSGDGLRLVDWDTVALAPPERDLWMLADGAAEMLTRWSESFGREPDVAALEYYRLEWALSDIVWPVSLFRSEHTESTVAARTWRALLENLEGKGPFPYGRPICP